MTRSVEVIVTDEHDYARRAAELLAARGKEQRPRAVDRVRGIAVVAQAISEEQRRRRQRRWFWAASGVAAAAAVTMLAGWFGARHGARTAQKSACVGAACNGAVAKGSVAGRPFEPGQSLVANKGRTEIVQFGAVTRIRLDELSELEYREGDATRRFGLLRGSIHLRVEKLRPEQRFVVETPDSEVEVRGTEFDVAVPEAGASCAGSRTRVSVREGAVEVRHQGRVVRVAAGEHWPEQCEQAAAPVNSPPIATAEPSPPRALHAARAAKPAEAERARGVSASELAEQNDLFAAATAARQAGRTAEALAGYERLLSRYPGGPLAESASIGKLRLLARANPGRAREEARRYLARYPRGMARAEAEALISEP